MAMIPDDDALSPRSMILLLLAWSIESKSWMGNRGLSQPEHKPQYRSSAGGRRLVGRES